MCAHKQCFPSSPGLCAPNAALTAFQVRLHEELVTKTVLDKIQHLQPLHDCSYRYLSAHSTAAQKVCHGGKGPFFSDFSSTNVAENFRGCCHTPSSAPCQRWHLLDHPWTCPKLYSFGQLKGFSMTSMYTQQQQKEHTLSTYVACICCSATHEVAQDGACCRALPGSPILFPPQKLSAQCGEPHLVLMASICTYIQHQNMPYTHASNGIRYSWICKKPPLKKWPLLCAYGRVVPSSTQVNVRSPACIRSLAYVR